MLYQLKKVKKPFVNLSVIQLWPIEVFISSEHMFRFSLCSPDERNFNRGFTKNQVITYWVCIIFEDFLSRYLLKGTGSFCLTCFSQIFHIWISSVTILCPIGCLNTNFSLIMYSYPTFKHHKHLHLSHIALFDGHNMRYSSLISSLPF